MGRKTKDEELAEEIQSPLAHDEDMRKARGGDAHAARRQARVKIGGRRCATPVAVSLPPSVESGVPA